MSIFSAVFGSKSAYKYSNEQKALPEREIKRIVSHHKITSVDADEETLVEQEILSARHGDGKISLRQVHEVLSHLYSTRKISLSDKQALMKTFVDYYKRHFK